MQALIYCSAFLNGLIAGGALDKAIMELPARKKLGASAFLDYFRATDLGPGMIYYPVLGLAAPIVTIVTAAVLPPDGGERTWMTYAAIAASVHVLSTAGAVSSARRLRSKDPDEKELEGILNRFASWNALRVLALLCAFAFSLAAL